MRIGHQTDTTMLLNYYIDACGQPYPPSYSRTHQPLAAQLLDQDAELGRMPLVYFRLCIRSCSVIGLIKFDGETGLWHRDGPNYVVLHCGGELTWRYVSVGGPSSSDMVLAIVDVSYSPFKSGT